MGHFGLAVWSHADAIATLIAGLGGALLGAWISWIAQTRGVREQHRASAAALLQDLQRIEANLQPRSYVPGDHPDVDSSRQQAKIHEWVQPLITQLASTDPDLVGLFMRLEELLVDHSREVASLLEATSIVTARAKTIDQTNLLLALPDVTGDARNFHEMQLERETLKLAQARADQEQLTSSWKSVDDALRVLLKKLEERLQRMCKR